MQIEQHIIDSIISKAELVNVISKDLKLKRSGSNYFACCPFHKEKSASFSINPSKQFFHCFGCGESGNVITYIMKYNGLDFIDAIKLLANQYGIHIPEEKKQYSKAEIQQQKQQKLTLTESLNKAVKFYQNNFLSSPLAQNYLKNRGLSSSIINHFLLGYVPNQSNPLSSIFNDYNNNQFLIDAGLVIKHESGKLYDRFRDRIIFPIQNPKGEIIGFGGRIINTGEPKYLNSPETILFNKSQELYGLYESQKQIRGKNYTVVVEGYLDVISLHQHGIDNAVATMGTAVTEEHIKKLFRLCNDIYYCFDGDKAGRKAAWRALERSISLVTDDKAVHFLFLPEDQDPDSFIRQFGYEKFEKERTRNALSMTQFLLKQLTNAVNLKSEEGKAKLISLAKPYLEQMKAPALQVILKQQIATLVELDTNVLESILNNRSRYAFYNKKWNKNLISLPKQTLPQVKFVSTIIRTALENIAWVHSYRLPEDLNNYSPEIQELVLFLDFVSNTYNDTDIINTSNIKDNIQFNHINLDLICEQKTNHLILETQEEFYQHLNHVFGFSQPKTNRFTKIKMKNDL